MARLTEKLVARPCSTCGKEVVRFACYMKAKNIFCDHPCVANFNAIMAPCSWPHCEEKIKARIHKRSDNGKVWYSTFGKTKRYAERTQTPLCDTHRDRIMTVSEGNHVKLVKLQAILDGNREYPGRGSQMLRLFIYDRDRGQCRSCHTPVAFKGGWHLDHIVPLYKGGNSKPENFQTLCIPCHDVKTLAERSELGGHIRKVHRNQSHFYKDKRIAKLEDEITQLKESVQFLAVLILWSKLWRHV